MSLCLTEGRTRRERERVKAMIRRRVRQLHGAAHDTGKHSHAISLISSDREGAEGNGYGHGHFHCTAPLATCPIYAFTKHMNTCTHKGVCPNVRILTNHLFSRTHACRTKTDSWMQKCTHKQTAEGRTMKWHGWRRYHQRWFGTVDGNMCAVIEIKQTLYSHTRACTRLHTHTHWNDTKPRGTGLVDLLIGCVFWQANLKNRPLSAHQRFSYIHSKTIQNASSMTDVTYLFMSSTSGPPCVSSISTCMRAGQPTDTDIFSVRTNASNRLSNCHHSSPFNQFVFPPVNGFQPSTHSKCFYWFKT